MSLLERTRDNDFLHIRRVDGGRQITVLRAVCSTCGNTDAEAKLTGGKTTITQEWANRLMRSKIQLGKDREHDLCFKCVEEIKAEREAAKALSAPPPPPPAVSTVKFEKPLPQHKSYNADQIALIMEMVAMHRKEGGNPYIAGWTDKRVAEELKSLIPHVTENHVGYLRAKYYGYNFQKPTLQKSYKLKQALAPTATPPWATADYKQLIKDVKDAPKPATGPGAPSRFERMQKEIDELKEVVRTLVSNFAKSATQPPSDIQKQLDDVDHDMDILEGRQNETDKQIALLWEEVFGK